MADSTIGFDLGTCIDAYPMAEGPSEACPEEERLLEGLRAGSDDAYEALLNRFQQPVYNLIHRLLNDPSETTDVVQEVFLKIFRNVGAFRGQSSLKTWVYRIAVNEAYNHRRWFSRHRRQEVGLEKEDESSRSYQDLLPDGGSSPFKQASDHETHVMIEEALQHLNPKFRAAVVLRDVEGLSYEEIAAILRISLGTVKSRIVRGRETLRARLADRLGSRPALRWTPQPTE